jgi:hypothetical protein
VIYSKNIKNILVNNVNNRMLKIFLEKYRSSLSSLLLIPKWTGGDALNIEKSYFELEVPFIKYINVRKYLTLPY